MKREEDEQLWDLLGQASRPEPSPFFARNVLRRLREERESSWSMRAFSWLRWRRLVPASAVAAAVIAALIFAHNPSVREQPPAEEPDLLANIDPEDYEVVADLDNLLALDENNPWDDDTSSL